MPSCIWAARRKRANDVALTQGGVRGVGSPPMERISLISLTWRQADQDDLGACTLPAASRPQVLPRLARALGSEELVYLATCNRVEIAYVAPRPGASTRPADGRRAAWDTLAHATGSRRGGAHHLRAWGGEGAVEHLFLVAAGLDSARVGETEIAGQLRRALDQADDLDLLGPRLALAGREALKLSRRVHRETRISDGPTSLASVAMGHVQERLARTPGPVVLIGVSDMTRRCATALASERRPFVVVNRTLARAEALCAEVRGGTARALEGYRRAPDPAEVLVLAVGASEPVLEHPDLERVVGAAPSGAPPLIVDLGVPPNVAPQDAARADLPRVDMQHITDAAARTRDERLHRAADARVLVDAALDAFRRTLGERQVAPLIAALHRRYKHTADEGVQRLLTRMDCLSPDDVDALRVWATTLAARFAHIPSRGLRSLAAEWGSGAVESFFRNADDVLTRELLDLIPEATQ